MMTHTQVSNMTLVKQFYDNFVMSQKPIKAQVICRHLTNIKKSLDRYTKLIDMFNYPRTIKKIDEEYEISFKNRFKQPISILIRLAVPDKYSHRILIVDDIVKTSEGE